MKDFLHRLVYVLCRASSYSSNKLLEKKNSSIVISIVDFLISINLCSARVEVAATNGAGDRQVLTTPHPESEIAFLP